jgi:hypothetical protein
MAGFFAASAFGAGFFAADVFFAEADFFIMVTYRKGGITKHKHNYGYKPEYNKPVVSGKPLIKLIFCTAEPAWPFIKLSM